MNRLHDQLHRLYLMHPLPAPGAADAPSPLVGPDGTVRALMLAVAQPAGWDALSVVWQAVQTELALPAPGIAVSGVDSLQLWFSLQQPVSAAQAQAFGQALCARYLAQLPPASVRIAPSDQPSAPGAVQHVAWVPQQQATGHWSAFVTHDLAALFTDDPWLDLAPSPDAQADLLSRLQSISRTAFDEALARLAPAAPIAPTRPPNTTAPPAAEPPPSPCDPSQTPRQFLLAVMHDPRVDLALRIEAAKALLPGGDGSPSR